MANTYYKPGAYNVIDDRTGFKVKSTTTRKEWTGLRVRGRSWEPRHPQDYLRSKEDRQDVLDPRSEQTDSFLTPNQAYNALFDPDTSEASASAAAGGGNTGDGSVTGLSADLTADSTNTLTITRTTVAAATDQDAGDDGEFRVTDSNGAIIGFGAMNQKFEGGGLSFTVKEDGSTAFAVGDTFTITVT